MNAITWLDLAGFDHPDTHIVVKVYDGDWADAENGTVSSINVLGKHLEWRNVAPSSSDSDLTRRFFAALKQEAGADLGLRATLDPAERITPVGFFKERLL